MTEDTMSYLLDQIQKIGRAENETLKAELIAMIEGLALASATAARATDHRISLLERKVTLPRRLALAVLASSGVAGGGLATAVLGHLIGIG